MLKALVLAPDNINKMCGYSNGVHACTRMLKSIGFTVDIACHELTPSKFVPQYSGLYRNVYYPRQNSPFVDQMNEMAMKLGVIREEFPSPWSGWARQLFPAVFMASMQDYDLFVIHNIACDWVKHWLPQGSKKMLFAHFFQTTTDFDFKLFPKSELDARYQKEIAPCFDYDIVAVTGSRDKEIFLRYRPEASVYHIPHNASVGPKRNLRAKSKRVVMNGDDNGSNRYALDWYMKNAHPILRQIDPEIELFVTHKIINYAKTKGYHKKEGITFTDFIPNLEKFMNTCDLVLVPVFQSEGVKTRLIEAMAMGLPVVTTPLGLSNTKLEHNKEVMVAKDGQQMARMIKETLDNLPLRQRLQKNGYAYIRNNHDIHAPTFDPLKKAILEAVGDNKADANKRGKRCTFKSPTKNIAASSVVEGLEHLTPWIIQRCQKAGYKNVALFGAGAHTHALIPLWNQFESPKITAILTSAPTGLTHIMRKPVILTDDFDPKSVDAVVASSQTYEDEMQEICAKKFPELPFETIWAPQWDNAGANRVKKSTRPQK